MCPLAPLPLVTPLTDPLHAHLLQVPPLMPHRLGLLSEVLDPLLIPRAPTQRLESIRGVILWLLRQVHATGLLVLEVGGVIQVDVRVLVTEAT
jgi:hypothetical protein